MFAGCFSGHRDLYFYKYRNFSKIYDKNNRILVNIFIRFGFKLYRQIVGIPIGNNCAPLVADLFIFCYERYFMSLSHETIRLTLLRLIIPLLDTCYVKLMISQVG